MIYTSTQSALVSTVVSGAAGGALGYGVGVALNMNPVTMAYFFGVNLLINQLSKYFPEENRLSASMQFGLHVATAASAVAFGILSQPVALALCTLALTKIVHLLIEDPSVKPVVA